MNLKTTIGIASLSLVSLAWAEQGKPDKEGRKDGERSKRDYFGQMLRGLDKDKNGEISFVEFSGGERVGRLTEEQQKKLFDRLDKNGDGMIRRDEIPRGSGRGDRRGRPFDPNGDGKVTFEEFSNNPRIAGVPDERKREIFDHMDRNSDGVLDRKDGRHGGPGGRPHGMPSFVDLDEDKSGSVSFEEFCKSGRMKDKSEDEQEDAFEMFDKDGNGEIGKDEFPRGPRPGHKGSKGKGPKGGDKREATKEEKEGGEES